MSRVREGLRIAQSEGPGGELATALEKTRELHPGEEVAQAGTSPCCYIILVRKEKGGSPAREGARVSPRPQGQPLTGEQEALLRRGSIPLGPTPKPKRGS